MRITSVDLLRLKTEGAGPVRPIICRINTDEGIYGLGEAGVAIVSGATAAYELLKDYATRIIGMNPLHHEVIWEKLYKDTFWAQGNGAIIMAAVSAIDTALWTSGASTMMRPYMSFSAASSAASCAPTPASSSSAGASRPTTATAVCKSMKTLAKPRWTKVTRQSRSTSSSSVSTAPT